MTTSSERPERRSVEDIEILDDRASRVGPNDGFLKLRRLTVRNVYADGTRSQDYACDIVSRSCVDAVTVVLFERTSAGVRVGLRENLRVPVWLRRRSTEILYPDTPAIETIAETVAGILEPGDGPDLEAGLRLRAAEEAHEEVGVRVPPEDIVMLGGASFPSPGITDEKVYFCAAEVTLSDATRPDGDGSTMEEVGGLLVFDLDEAIARCRDGRIPDMKTEIALTRLRDTLGVARVTDE